MSWDGPTEFDVTTGLYRSCLRIASKGGDGSQCTANLLSGLYKIAVTSDPSVVEFRKANCVRKTAVLEGGDRGAKPSWGAVVVHGTGNTGGVHTEVHLQSFAPDPGPGDLVCIYTDEGCSTVRQLCGAQCSVAVSAGPQSVVAGECAPAVPLFAP